MNRFFRNLRTLPARFEAAVDAADATVWIGRLDKVCAGVGYAIGAAVTFLIALAFVAAAKR